MSIKMKSKTITLEELKNLPEYETERRYFYRGDIWYALLGSDDNGLEEETHVTKGRRPVLVIQNDIGNKFSDYVIILPLTDYEHKKGKMLPTQVKVDSTRKPSMVLCENPITIKKDYLINFVHHLPQEEMTQVEIGIMKSLGIVRI